MAHTRYPELQFLRHDFFLTVFTYLHRRSCRLAAPCGVKRRQLRAGGRERMAETSDRAQLCVQTAPMRLAKQAAILARG